MPGGSEGVPETSELAIPSAEPLVEPAPTEQQVLTPVRPGRPSTARWGIALLTAAAVVAVAAAGVYILGAGGRVSGVADYVPVDALAYVEFRLDLPGDQKSHVASILSRFPGFADQAQLDAKIDEALDRLIAQATNGEHRWTSEFRPWLGGAAAFAAWPGGASSAGHGLVVILTSDPTKAAAWVAANAPDGATTTETHGGATLTIVTPQYGEAVAWTTTGEALIVGDVAAVEAGLDAKAGSGLASVAAFKAAENLVDQDVLGFGFFDLKRLMESGAALGSMTDLTAGALAAVPDWAAFTLRAEDDALVSEVTFPDPDGALVADGRASVLAGRLPGDVVAAVDVRSVGAAIANAIERARSDPALKDQVAQLDQAAALLGGDPGSFFSWMGDTTVALAIDGQTFAGGVVIEATDPVAAGQRLTQLQNLLVLAGGSAGISVRDEAYDGETIHILDLGDVSGLSSTIGAQLPFPISGHAELSYALSEGRLVIGADPGFVKAVLDAKVGSTLADEPGYRTTIERAGSQNAFQLYVDLAELVTAAERFMTGDDLERYRLEAKPYLEPFLGFAQTVVSSDGRGVVRAVITFK